MSTHIHSYIALGDSYTIGEGVPLFESFPYQVIQLLRKQNVHFHAPEIIAKTAFTTFELGEQILQTQLEESYDFVTLLIGVNNQYRGLSINEYEKEFTFLLHKAIHLTGGNADQVIVLSIPDWGSTPFAKERDTEKIALEIDHFNEVAKLVCQNNSVHFLDITTLTKIVTSDSSFLVKDGLHYSAKMYAEWAFQVAEKFSDLIEK